MSPDSFDMPSLIGLPAHEALALLSSHNLNPRITYIKDDADFADGIILQQKPQSLHKVKPQQLVFLVISKKPAGTKAPHYLMLQEKDILDRARNAGIKLKIYRLEGSNLPITTCIAQMPAPDTFLSPDKSMIIYVAQQASGLRIFPSFSGHALQDVYDFLEEHHFRYHVIFPELSRQTDDAHYTIIDQRPFAGSFIDYANPPFVQIKVI